NPVTVNNVSTTGAGGTRGQLHVNQILLNAVHFLTAFPTLADQLFVRADDADYYYDVTNQAALGGGIFIANAVTLPGIADLNFGDHYQTVQVGNIGSVNAQGVPLGTSVGQMSAGALFLRAENDLDRVVVNANTVGESMPVLGSPTPF